MSRQGVSVGAIRWDAWYANYGAALSTSYALGPANWQYRAPVHTQVLGPNLIRYAPTQATFDAEITKASASGLNYWAYLRYDPAVNPEMNVAWGLHQSSAISAQMKWCWIYPASTFYNSGSYSSQVSFIVSAMGQANYIQVLSGRPLLYFQMQDYQLSGMPNIAAAISSLRSSAQSAGLGNPYIVLMDGANYTRSAVGADAISKYIDVPNYGQKAAYATFAGLVQTDWPAMAASSPAIVPTVMCGWDRRPRIFRPVPWEASGQQPYLGHDNYVLEPTSAELAAHLQAGINYVAGNSTVCPSQTVLCYAWSECDEGGVALMPTLGDPAGSKLAAVQGVLAT